MSALLAAPVTIGVIKSTGDFRVDGSTVRGNGTVFEGNQIETTATRSVIQISNTQVTLLPESRAKMYRDRAILEKGSSLVRAGVVEAGSLQITSAKDASVQVEMTRPGTVSVFARSGSAEVRNSSGVLVASMNSGMALAFTPQAAVNAPVQMTGTVQVQNSNYYLTDETTKVKAELRGDVKQYVNARVRITGSNVTGAAGANGATQVVQVARVERLDSSRPAGAGATAGGTAVQEGVGKKATIAIIGGVAAAATVGGLTAAGVIGDEDTASR